MKLNSKSLAQIMTTLSAVFFASLFCACPPAKGGEPAPLRPEESQQWIRHGINPTDAAHWKHVGFSPEEAKLWIEAGIPFAEWAEQWRGEGFEPEQAKQWVKKVNVYTAREFHKRGFGVKEALDWIDNGVRSGLRASEFRGFGFTAAQAGSWWRNHFYPENARDWRNGGFSAEEALEWKYGRKTTHYMSVGVKGYSQEVYSVEWARRWKSAGFGPDEAKWCRLLGMEFDEALRWTEAGFALSEAFEWKDAGFTREEAVLKRDEGLSPIEAERSRDGPFLSNQDEILSFHSDIVLHPDATLSVTESIEIRKGPGGPVREHFKRIFGGKASLRHNESSAHTVTAPTYRILAILMDGMAAGFSEDVDSFGDMAISINPKGCPPEEGIHNITITYQTDNRLLQLRNHDELFYDVIGRYLNAPAQKASAAIRLPQGADIIFTDGYAGPPERKYFDAEVKETDGGDRALYTVSRPLKVNMAFQISMGLTKGFSRPDPMSVVGNFDRLYGQVLTAAAVFIAGLFIVTVYFVFVWFQVGRDPRKGPVAPTVEPPLGISPALAGFIASEGKFHPRMIAAMLVQSAQSGAIRIAREGPHYRISRATGTSSPRPPHESAFLDRLFEMNQNIVIDKKLAKRTLRSIGGPLKATLQKEYTRYFASNRSYLLRFIILFFIAAAVGLWFPQAPRAEMEVSPRVIYGAFAFAVSVILLSVFARLLKTPTALGNQVRNEIEGFMKFLDANYRQARILDEHPEPESPPYLEKYLPYAVALGVDSEYVSIRAKRLEWYSGGTGGFSPYDFTSVISAKATRAVKSLQR